MELSEKTKLCVALLAVHIVISLFTVVPGHLSQDETLYHLMAKNFIERGSFEIWNGYQDFPSAELVLDLTSVHNGRLVSQYPYLFPILAGPFYLFLGYRSLFLLNAVFFIGVVFLTYGICQKLFKNKNMSLNACLLLSLATFAWEYSQAAWPHMASTFFVVAAFYLFLNAFHENDFKRLFYSALLCGFLSGIAIAIRLDSMFILPCFIFAVIFLKHRRLMLLLGVIIGTIPGFIFLSTTNYVKFGILSPFSYGGSAEKLAGISEISKYFPLAIVIAGIFFVSLISSYYPVISFFKKNKMVNILLSLVLIFLVFMIPEIKSMIWKTVNGAYQLIFDFRIRDFGIKEGGLSRSMGGGMVYLGGIKKSLLQSCPYLVILIIPFLRIITCDKGCRSLILLFLIPLAYIGFYSYSGGWHGGMSLNLRYFVPILPFFSILVAFSWDKLICGNTSLKNKRFDRLFVILFVITLMLFLYLQRTLQHPDVQEFYCLNLPLMLAGTILTLLLLCRMVQKKNWTLLYETTVATLLVSMIWSGAMAFFYDYRLFHREKRRISLEYSILTAEFISGNAILFMEGIELFAHLKESDKIRIANPSKDNFKDFRKLVDFHFKEGNNVYIAFRPTKWNWMNNMGLLDEYDIIYFGDLENLLIGQLFESAI